MPERVRSRALVVGLLILLIVAGIRALGPPGGWGGHVSHAVFIGAGLEIVLAGLLTGLRFRYAPAGVLAVRLHRLLSNILIGCLVAVAILVVFNEFNTNPRQPKQPPAATTHLPHRVRLRTSLGQGGFNHGVLARYLLIALLVIAITAVLIYAWRRRRAKLRVGPAPELVVEESAEDELARAVASGRAALGELDDARAAIIACYVAMELSLASAGAERGVAETPDELLARAVAAELLPPPPAERLTALFYEARYSTHPMPASQRDQAERSLTELAADLPLGDLR